MWLVLGRLWSPFNYANPLWSVREQALAGAPWWLPVVLAAWTLPFLWIGVSMSMRRAVDAAFSPWIALLFFLPWIHYAMMLGLSLAPARTVPMPPWRRDVPQPVPGEKLKSALIGLGAALLVTIPSVLFAVFVRERYSASLFLGVPFTIGSVTAYFYNRGHPRGVGETQRVAWLSVGICALAIMLFALEGAFCLILAFPLAAMLASVGAVVGQVVANRGWAPASHAAVVIFIAPFASLTDPRPVPVLREIVTVVEIAAPRERVWENVVSFPDLPSAQSWVFRAGVAAPRRARIEGSGVGAVRYCDFTTGSFVEPITDWEDGRLLAFDITSQAPPMREWSPYRTVYAPHLNGYFRATRGEFRLSDLPGGGTRLEGRTWYRVEMAPEDYWRLPSDYIVQAIHGEVLRHIKQLSESAP